jgi:uncharacterized protein (DUF4415 family)
MNDSEIDTSDIAPLDDDFFDRASLNMPEGKSAVLLNVDNDILEWFKSQESEFNRLVNTALRDFVDSHR